MNHGFRFAVLVVLAVAFLLGCGEKAVEPDDSDLGAMVSKKKGPTYAAESVRGGPGREEHNQKGTFLVGTEDGLIAVSPKGETFLFNPFGSAHVNVEVSGTRIYAMKMRDIAEFDHMGNIVSVFSVPDRIGYPAFFTALPGGEFAVHDTDVDSVYFLDSSGTLFQAVDMPDEDPPGHLQMMKGLVRDGSLIISETGTRKIAAIDLTTYAATVFREFDPTPRGWLGDIDHLGRYYYITRWDRLQRFSETDGLEDVAIFEDDDSNMVALAILRHHAYVALNFAGKVCRVNLSSGKTKLVAEGLNYPVDIEFVPVILEPPPVTP